MLEIDQCDYFSLVLGVFDYGLGNACVSIIMPINSCLRRALSFYSESLMAY